MKNAVVARAIDAGLESTGFFDFGKPKLRWECQGLNAGYRDVGLLIGSARHFDKVAGAIR